MLKPYLKVFVVLFIVGKCTIAQKVVFHQYLTSNEISPDAFGQTVVADGDLLLIGSWNGTDSSGNFNTSNAGAAYAYRLVNDDWQLFQKIVLPTRGPRDFFSSSITLTGNNFTTGAPRRAKFINSTTQWMEVGEIYLYDYVNDNWDLKQSLKSSDHREQDQFGEILTGDNFNLFVNAPGQDYDEIGMNLLAGAGAVYHFIDSNGYWVENAKITTPNRNNGERGYGENIFFKNDQLFVAGMDGFDENGLNHKTGAGSIFSYDILSDHSYNFKQKIVPSLRDSFAQFGFMSAGSGNNKGASPICMQSEILVVGSAYSLDSNGTNFEKDAGMVTIFRRGVNGLWKETGNLFSNSRNENGFFGTSISIYDSLMAIGAPGENTDSANQSSGNDGAVYLYKLNAKGKWSLLQKLSPTKNESRKYGSSVAIYNNYLFVGAPWDNVGTIHPKGAVYVYRIEKSGEVGIQNRKYNSNLSIFPNPTSGMVHVDSQSLMYILRISDLSGKEIVVNQFSKPARKVSFDSSELPSGVYLLQITSNEGVSTKKFVKQD